MRLFIAARSRFAEDSLAAAVARGVTQAVVLGAGLDTLALRHPHRDLRVFEVDHPATQAWKRARLAAAGLDMPASLTLAPVDFEHGTLAVGLAQAGFDAGAPAFFAWLGVVPYLTTEAVIATLAFIASVPSAEVVFDYSVPRALLTPARGARAEAMGARVAAAGEPWLSHFDPAALAEQLRALGFADVEDLGPGDIRTPFLGAPASSGGGGDGPRVVRARRL